jgi:hypothetical protein
MSATVNIFTPCWNEQMLLPHFYKWYTSRLGDVRFNVYDNASNDLTVWLASALGMNGATYQSGNKLDERALVQIKGYEWKKASGWVINCDVDEWLDITRADLDDEIANGTTIIRTEGYDMCNVNDTITLADITHGVRNPMMDKRLMFNGDHITDIGYGAGCHRASPQGLVVDSKKVYKLYHMKYWNKAYMVARYEAMQRRMSENNIANSFGKHYMISPDEVANEYDTMIANATKVRP